MRRKVKIVPKHNENESAKKCCFVLIRQDNRVNYTEEDLQSFQ